jgi:hypothetical protein
VFAEEVSFGRRNGRNVVCVGRRNQSRGLFRRQGFLGCR